MAKGVFPGWVAADEWAGRAAGRSNAFRAWYRAMARDCRLGALHDSRFARAGQSRRFSPAHRGVLRLFRVQLPRDAWPRAVCPPERLVVPLRALLVVPQVLPGESELLPARSFGAQPAWPLRVEPRVLPPVRERCPLLQPVPSRAPSQRGQPVRQVPQERWASPLRARARLVVLPDGRGRASCARP